MRSSEILREVGFLLVPEGECDEQALVQITVTHRYYQEAVVQPISRALMSAASGLGA